MKDPGFEPRPPPKKEVVIRVGYHDYGHFFFERTLLDHKIKKNQLIKLSNTWIITSINKKIKENDIFFFKTQCSA